MLGITDFFSFFFFLTVEYFSMKIEILFYFIFQGEDPLKSLDDIFPEG